MPDAFLPTGQLGAVFAQAHGDKHARAEDFSPYYRLHGKDRARASLAAAVEFVKRHGQRQNSEPGGAAG